MGHLLDLFFADRAAWFGVPALAGTAFMLVRLVFVLLGGDHAGLADADPTSHFDLAGHDHHAFEWLSVQALVAFGAGFGWGGLGALRGSGMGMGASVITALGVGFGVMWLYGLLIKRFYGLEVSGNIDIADAVGVTGDVYLTVPAAGAGAGQVKLVVGGRQRIYSAVSRSSRIATGERVRVVDIADQQTLGVVPA